MSGSGLFVVIRGSAALGRAQTADTDRNRDGQGAVQSSDRYSGPLGQAGLEQWTAILPPRKNLTPTQPAQAVGDWSLFDAIMESGACRFNS